MRVSNFSTYSYPAMNEHNIAQGAAQFQARDSVIAETITRKASRELVKFANGRFAWIDRGDARTISRAEAIDLCIVSA